MRNCFLQLGIWWIAVLAGLGLADGVVASDLDFFETRIRPVLADHCYDCHSQRSEPIRSGLRVDNRENLIQGGERGPAIRPGNSEDSLLFQALTHRHPELAMPHKRPKLSDPALEHIRQWIDAGAPWPESDPSTSIAPSGIDLAARKERLPWIWEPPVRQALPKIARPKWPQEDLDYFILAGLEKADLPPASDADRRTWLRRISLALTGLPPSPESMREFQEDSSSGAREKVVDRLLASPHFGERWARHWMDLVRYAESRGHESDFIIPNAYHYRDYLVRAFNDDLSYDQVVVEHVAGDLLPEPRLNPATGANESILATGWPFLGEEVHSPVDIRQDECDRIDNKVDVFSKTFLGLTVSCARCHDHKFDALRAKDYYALSGFFLSSSYRQVRFESMEQNRRVAEDLAATREEQNRFVRRAWGGWAGRSLGEVAAWMEAAAQSLQTEEANRERFLQKIARERNLKESMVRLWLEYLIWAKEDSLESFRDWAGMLAGNEVDSPATNSEESPNDPIVLLPSTAQMVADYTSSESAINTFWRTDGFGFGPGPVRVGDLLWSNSGEPALVGVATYARARRDLFWKNLKLSPGNENDPGSLGATSRAGQMIRTRTFILKSGRLHYLIRGSAKVYAAVDSHIMITGPLHGKLVRQFETKQSPTPTWVTHDLGDYQGHRVHVEFGPVGDQNLEVLMVVDADQKPADPVKPTWPGVEKYPASVEKLVELVTSFLKEAAIKMEQNRWEGNDQLTLVADWMVRHPDLLGMNEAFKERNDAYARSIAELRKQARWKSRTAVALMDGSGVDEHVLLRGKPFSPGELAPRALPEAWAGSEPVSNQTSSGRLELARQLADPANPLVARVMVNRVWHHLFGRGIVPSVDNFGYLGQRPTHPELLDHLAWHFVHEENWSIKKLIRKLVLSRTYGMNSVAAAARAEETDPANLLWHRMPVRRLEAEVIRDALLMVSGRLNPDLLGPPVPVHLTEFVVGRGRPGQSGPLDGNGRRSIYTAVRRNFLPTFMLTFDYPTPFTTMGRRNVTNVPAQSLALMNDELVHDQARVWAERLLRESPQALPEARIKLMFETAYGRPPSPMEINACLETWQELRDLQEGPQAWSELAHALLNANEFVYVR